MPVTMAMRLISVCSCVKVSVDNPKIMVIPVGDGYERRRVVLAPHAP